MITLEIDDSEFKQYVEELENKFDDLGEFLSQFCENDVIPELEAEAASQRKVITGTYAFSWEADADSENSAVITTDAAYWKYLEYGTRYIAPRPVVQTVAGRMTAPLKSFIVGALGLGSE